MPSKTLIDTVIGLCEAFGRKATEATIGAYDIGLRGLTNAQIEAAGALALQRCKFMPVPSELRELAQTSGLSYEAMAEQAFQALSNAVRRHNDMESINFTDGLINATVRTLGGWEMLHADDMTSERFTVWYRKDFLATYARFCKSGASEELRRYLAGSSERENLKFIGQTLRSGEVYTLERFAPVAQVGSSYKPALPAPAIPNRDKPVLELADIRREAAGLIESKPN